MSETQTCSYVISEIENYLVSIHARNYDSCSDSVSYGWVGPFLFDVHFQFRLEWTFVDSPYTQR